MVRDDFFAALASGLRKIIFLTILLVACPAIAQPPSTAGDLPVTKKYDGPFDGLRQATVSLGLVSLADGKQIYKTLGSGVFVASGEHSGCLLTARHMFLAPEQNWKPNQIWIRVPPEVGKEQPDLGVTLPLVQDGKPLWRSPDDGADLAVIGIPDLTKYGTLTAISLSQIGESDDIFQGASIIALGYPALVGEDFLISPLARGGIVSWVDLNDPIHKPFLIDANLYPGNSGGPVFHIRTGLAKSGGMVIGGGIALIGIVSQGHLENAPVVAGGVPIPVRDAQSGKTNPAQAIVNGVGGIGIIEPVSRAKAVLAECLHSAG